MNLEQRLERLRVQLRELQSYADLATAPMGAAEVQDGAGERSVLEVGEPWPEGPFPLRFRFRARVPALPGEGPLLLRMDVGGEGLAAVDGRPLGGLNRYHREVAVGETQVGQELTIVVEAVPRGLFGTPEPAPRLREARFVRPNQPVRALHEDVDATVDAAETLAERSPDVAILLAEAASDTLASLRLPRKGTLPFLSRLVEAPAERALQESVWEGASFDGQPLRLDDATRARLAAARQGHAERVSAIRQRYASAGGLVLSGHAHIDLAWLWPLEETRRKVVRTFWTALALMERYPDWTFNQSTAQIYRYLESDAPGLLRRIRDRVAEGRWEVVGGMWVEPDGNLLSGESWARQLLYGQRELQRLTGARASVAWLPDSFGFAANLPQLFRQAGLPYFFTTKLNWTETNAFPHDLYWWEGLDGSRVLAHSFDNPDRNYNGVIQARDTSEVWGSFRGKRHAAESLFTFGWGDGGGGPSAQMLERFERQRDMPGLPRLRHGRVDAFYRGVEGSDAAERLPVWVGEQYLEFHRGTYTSQALIKALHRRLEHDLVEAETAATLCRELLAEAYPELELRRSWEALLRNQFHDILPGSSIRTVVEQAQRELRAAVEEAARLRDEALQRLSASVAEGPAVVVWNLSMFDRPAGAAWGTRWPEGGDAGAVARRARAALRRAAGRQVPGLGYLILPLGGEAAAPDAPDAPAGGALGRTTGRASGAPAGAGLDASGAPGAPAEPGLEAGDTRLENDHLRVDVLEDGTIEMFDKDARRRVLAEPGNRLRCFDDVPRAFEAWELDQEYERSGRDLTMLEPPRLVRTDAMTSAIRVRRGVDGLVVEQDYVLCRGSRRLDVHTRMDVDVRRTLLRAYFPTGVRAPRASYETAFGRVERPTHRNTSWDEAAFEVPGLRWADLSEPGYGVGLSSDAKYGYACRGSVLSLTLLRTPVYPDPFADAGQHAFVYAILPHLGNDPTPTLVEACDLNAPLRVHVVDDAHAGAGARSSRSVRLLHAGNGLAFSALKRSEDGAGLVLRVYEPIGASRRLQLSGSLTAAPGSGPVGATDLLEEADQGPLPGDRSVRPFEVVTLRLGRRGRGGEGRSEAFVAGVAEGDGVALAGGAGEGGSGEGGNAVASSPRTIVP